MKRLYTLSKVLLVLCWALLLGTLLSFWSLLPVSQYLHSLYAFVARLSVGLYIVSLFLLPIAAAAGLAIALARKAWRLAALYIALVPVWLYAVAVIGNAV